jgi:Flp pilus assembly protein TadG
MLAVQSQPSRAATRARTRSSIRFLGSEANAIIEFALVLPLLLLVLFGITELGRAIATVEVLTSAAREGARIAAVTAPDQAAVTARVNAVLAASSVTPSQILVEGPVGMPESTIRVTVRSNFDVLSGSILPFSGTLNLQGVSVMRHEG